MRDMVRNGVKLRPYRPEDEPTLRGILSRQQAHLGTELAYPDPSQKTTVVAIVAEDAETGEVVGMGTAHMGVEISMVIDPKWGAPRDRIRAIIETTRLGSHLLMKRGFNVAYARAVGPKRWVDRLVRKLCMTREAAPVVKLDMAATFGRR